MLKIQGSKTPRNRTNTSYKNLPNSDPHHGQTQTVQALWYLPNYKENAIKNKSSTYTSHYHKLYTTHYIVNSRVPTKSAILITKVHVFICLSQVLVYLSCLL